METRGKGKVWDLIEITDRLSWMRWYSVLFLDHNVGNRALLMRAHAGAEAGSFLRVLTCLAKDSLPVLKLPLKLGLMPMKSRPSPRPKVRWKLQ